MIGLFIALAAAFLLAAFLVWIPAALVGWITGRVIAFIVSED